MSDEAENITDQPRSWAAWKFIAERTEAERLEECQKNTELKARVAELEKALEHAADELRKCSMASFRHPEETAAIAHDGETAARAALNPTKPTP